MRQWVHCLCVRLKLLLADAGCYVHIQGLKLFLGAFRNFPVENLYVDAHDSNIWCYTCKYFFGVSYQDQDQVSNKISFKYMKLFDARPNVIRTFGFPIV